MGSKKREDFAILTGLKNGGLLLIAHPYTFTIGAPPPPRQTIFCHCDAIYIASTKDRKFPSTMVITQ